MTVVAFILEGLPSMSGPTIQPVMVLVAASWVLSVVVSPVDMESTQLPTYFFLPVS